MSQSGNDAHLGENTLLYNGAGRVFLARVGRTPEEPAIVRFDLIMPIDNVAGTAHKMLAVLTARLTSKYRADALVVALDVGNDFETDGGYKRVEKEIHASFAAEQPRLAAIILEGFEQHDLLAQGAHELLADSGVYTKNALGRDATVLAIILEADRDREIVAERIGWHMKRRTNLGDGTVILSSQLRDQSILDIVQQEVL